MSARLLSLAILLLSFPALSLGQEAQPRAGFSISVDGETIAGDRNRPESPARPQPDISVTYEGFDIGPVLSASAFTASEGVRFEVHSNYPAFIADAEIVVFANKDRGTPLAVIPLGRDHTATWSPPDSETGDISYLARVYGGSGRFDETAPQALWGAFRSATEIHDPTTDQTAFRSIPVRGGAVTIRARNVPADALVRVMGEAVPITDNALLLQRILPPGDHDVSVSLASGPDDAIAFSQSVNIPEDDWFYVGMADLTLGTQTGSGAILAADPGEYSPVYAKGRLAFYLKGKIRGDLLLTAAADTSDGNLNTLFTGLEGKDPRSLLRRIDPDAYYPVYGDDSDLVDDAPTNGKFYLRLDRGGSHVMWGNFRTRVRGTHFLAHNRALYGASAAYEDEATTAFGEHKSEVVAYAAQPGTLPQRDVLRGTGGSAYFLRQQDVAIGTEAVSVELRDAGTGVLVSRRALQQGRDYTIDYVQGVVLLNEPLNSSDRSDAAVRSGTLGDTEAHLVVQYEYTPTLSDAEGYAIGGRAQTWLDDHVSVGVTAMSQMGEVSNQRLAGADLKLRLSDSTYLEAEVAGSEGVGASEWTSADGGLTFTEHGLSGAGNAGLAYRLKGQVDLAKLSGGAVEGEAGAFFEHRDPGFSGLDGTGTGGRTTWGAHAQGALTSELDAELRYEQSSASSGKSSLEAAGELSYDIDNEWRVSAGITALTLATPSGTALDNGSRTDAGLRLSFAPDEQTSVYGFAQTTVLATPGFARNDRLGAGGQMQLTEQVGVEGELSYGTTGLGALAGITYDPTSDEHYYAGYRIDPDRRYTSLGQSSLDDGGVVVGARRRYNDAVTAFGETNYGPLSGRRSLTNAYGVTITPDSRWTVNGGLEAGQVIDPDASDFDRKALSLGLGFREDDVTASARGEARLEDSADNTRDRQTYLAHADLGLKTSQDWRLVGDFNAVVSRSDQAAVLDGDYVEAKLGYAYRPADNGWLNALFNYTFLYDLPGSDQVTANGSTFGPKQRSHVLSADANVNVNAFLTLGGKVALRAGEISTTRASNDFLRSSAYLAVLRADLHLFDEFDLLLEGRVLGTPEAHTTDWGALAALYRDFGNNVSVGAGYNFGVFSDDLTDLTYDDQGAFLNVLSKF